MTVRRAYVLCNDPPFRFSVDDESSPLIEYGTTGRGPSLGTSTWAICGVFGEVAPLRCSEHEYEQAFAAPLRFCMQGAQQAMSSASRPKRIVLVGLADASCAETLARVGIAALMSVARSLAIECASASVVVNGIAASTANRFPATLLWEDALPAGCCVDLYLNKPPHAQQLRSEPREHVAGQPRVAIVTGAARGLGRAIAQRFADRGDSVLLVDKDEDTLQKTVHEVSAAGGSVSGFATDVRCRSQLRAAAEGALARWGAVNVWVNNAGIALRKPIAELTVAEFDQVIDTNFKGTLLGAQIACEAMREGGGVVLNMSSTAARTAGVVYHGCYNQYAPYAASKAAIESLTKILPRIVPSSIRIAGIAPGPISTELVERLYTRAQRRELEDHIPARRLGNVDDIAAAADFLTLPFADFISGAVLAIDGGLSSWAGGTE